MWNKPIDFLGVTKRTGSALDPADVIFDDVVNIPTSGGISAGIKLRTLMLGLVPIFEEQLARKSEGYNIKEWRDLEPFDRAFTVAVFRTEKAVEAHQMEAESESMKSKSK